MVKQLVKKAASQILLNAGYKIVSAGNSYIHVPVTIEAASREGLSLCDYVEREWGEIGVTQAVIDKMAYYGAFDLKNPHVLEIGPGTGKFLEKVLEKCTPEKYEIYETSREWADWLSSKYPVVTHKADGVTLRQTKSSSIDLLHAHGVFVYVPFLVAYQYFLEISRVVKPGGIVVFDIISEECLDKATLDKWINLEKYYMCYLSGQYVISIFKAHNFMQTDTFICPLYDGKSRYMVFKKMADEQASHLKIE
jgi:SAM-dependent methyltransferase